MAKAKSDLQQLRILNLLKSHTVEETAKLTGLAPAEVKQARDQALAHGVLQPRAKITRAQQTEYRKGIAAWIKERIDELGIRTKAAIHFAVSQATIGNIMQEHGLSLVTKKPSLDAKTLFKFVANILRGETPSAAGEAVGISREYATKLRDYATEAGLLDAVIAASGDEGVRRKIQKLIDRAKTGAKE